MFDKYTNHNIQKNLNSLKYSLNNRNTNNYQNYKSDNTLIRISQNIKKKEEIKGNNFKRKIEIEIPNKKKISTKKVFTPHIEMKRNLQIEQVTDKYETNLYNKEEKLKEKNICTQTIECKIIN